jgi:hypothetical protein
MSARWSLGEGRPICQTVGCRQLAAPVAVEVLVPFNGGVELALDVCPGHREVVERAVVAVGEVVSKAGLDVAEAGAAACWAGQAS